MGKMSCGNRNETDIQTEEKKRVQFGKATFACGVHTGQNAWQVQFEIVRFQAHRALKLFLKLLMQVHFHLDVRMSVW